MSAVAFFYRLPVLQGNPSTWYCSQILCCIYNITASFTDILGSPVPLPLLLSLKAASTAERIYPYITRQNCCYSFCYLNRFLSCTNVINYSSTNKSWTWKYLTLLNILWNIWMYCFSSSALLSLRAPFYCRLEFLTNV